MLVIDGTIGQMIEKNIHHLNNERIFNLLTNNGLYNLSINTFDSRLLSVLGIEQNILRWLTGRLGTSLHYYLFHRKNIVVFETFLWSFLWAILQ